MKRWFDTEKDQAAKLRALDVQTAQQSKTSLKPRPGGGKRSRAEGGVATAARLARSKKVKEAAKTWHWPSFYLRLPANAACCVTIPVLCLLRCPVPCQVDGTPRIPHICVGCVALCSSLFCFVMFCFGLLLYLIFCPSAYAFPWVSCVVLAPPAGHRNAGLVLGLGLVFLALCLCPLLFFFFLPSVWSCRVALLLVHLLDIS